MMKPAAAAKGAIGRLGQMLARAMPTSSGSGTASSRRASAAGGEPSPWHWWGLLTRRPQRQEDPREVWALQQRVQLELAEQAAQLAWLEEQRERMLMEAVTSDHSPSATTGAGRLQQQCGGGASDVRKQGAQPLPAKAAPEPAAAAAAAPLLAVPSEQPLEPVAAPQPVLQPPAVRAVKLLDMNAGNAFFGLRTEAGAEDSEWGLGGSCGDLSVDDDGGMEGSLGGGLEDGAGMEEEALLWGELEPEGGELEEGWDQFGGLVDEQVELTQQVSMGWGEGAEHEHYQHLWQLEKGLTHQLKTRNVATCTLAPFPCLLRAIIPSPALHKLLHTPPCPLHAPSMRPPCPLLAPLMPPPCLLHAFIIAPPHPLPPHSQPSFPFARASGV